MTARSQTPASHSLAQIAAVGAVTLAILAGGDAIGFGWAGPFAMIAAVGAVAWLNRRARAGWFQLWLGRPRRWWATLGGAVAATVATLVVTSLAAAALGTAPVTEELAFVHGNLAGYVFLLVVGWTTAAFGEEIVFRGFLMGRIHAAMGRRRGSALVALVAQAVLFGLIHAYQGPTGMLLTGLAGLCVGVAVYATRRNLWIGIVSHGLTDTIGVTVLYLTPGQ